MLPRLIAFATAVLILSGCSQSGPTLAHGQPVEHWVRALRDPDAKVRKRAADVLGNVGAADATVVPALATALKDQDRVVREATVLALLKMGSAAKDAAPALVEASKDSDARVRSYAAKALEKIQASP
jgi:HEAT repeat protein